MVKRKSPQIEISIIVPCFNEEKTIQLLLQAILDQNIEPEKMEVIIADAMSTDNTRSKIQEFAFKNPKLSIRIVDNIKRTIPAAINLAANSAQGEYLLRLDAHSVPAGDYVQNSIDLLKVRKSTECWRYLGNFPEQRYLYFQSNSTSGGTPVGSGGRGISDQCKIRVCRYCPVRRV